MIFSFPRVHGEWMSGEVGREVALDQRGCRFDQRSSGVTRARPSVRFRRRFRSRLRRLRCAVRVIILFGRAIGDARRARARDSLSLPWSPSIIATGPPSAQKKSSSSGFPEP